MKDLVKRIAMPPWLETLEQTGMEREFSGDEDMMRFAVHLAVENVRHGTGGPFAAAVFESESRRLVAVGINVVVPARQSWAHAEMTALACAQNARNDYSLKGCILVSSCEPCAMCTGSIPWSGVDRLLYGASKAMAEKAGFDEGYRGEDWREELEKRQIRVTGPLLGTDAFEPFALYLEKNGTIY